MRGAANAIGSIPRWSVVFAGFILASAVIVAWGGDGHVSSGDPGGKILAELKPVGQALPRDANVLYRYEIEPQWDSCDGRPETYGWGDVYVQIHFTSKSSARTIVDQARAEMSKLGWQLSHQQDDISGIDVVWTKVLKNVTEAKAALTNQTPDGAWNLDAFAPPVGPRVHGC